MSDQNPKDQTQQHNVDARFSDVWQAIDSIRDKKQNKFNAMVWVPLLLYVASLTVGGIYGAAELSASLGSMEKQVATATKDNYSTPDADRDFALRDERIGNLQETQKEQKEQLSRIEGGIQGLGQKIDRIHPQ